MSRYKSKEARSISRTREQAKKWPELVNTQNDLDAHLEYEVNKVRFGLFQPRNKAQEVYAEAIEAKRIIFALGPAGVGKTFVATSIACEMLEAGEIERIIIARPMVGCDEEIGALPGTEAEKYAPWLSPFFDVLDGKLGKKKVKSYLEYEKIVARPLMMMRGTTFRNALVILDEAQNTTPGQMKMFLTRLGEGSRVIIDGDLEQSDLPTGKLNGLADATYKLRNSHSAAFVTFTEDDITRDPLVREIVLAYRNSN